MCTMLSAILLLALAAFPGHADCSAPAADSTCGEKAVLRCGAPAEPGVQYRHLTWYKITDDPQSSRKGLISRNLWSNSTKTYSQLERPVFLREDSSDLVIFNTTAQDSGHYCCLLSAPVGHKNQEAFIRLKVSGCLEEQAGSEGLWLEIILFLAVALSLVICFICWVCLRNLSVLRESRKQGPSEKKNLRLIYSPSSKGPSYQHVCV
ncbi:CD83 antigen [Paramormyrops kingsleyae]|uniref:CD83 molecule n=1 Tax=Paramormyrops kingsleyae TaxID=1676925 RepID=A0A3B3SU72_9TELE|nr:CD83 antigen [Paramormyrops kingsleyae]